MRLKAAPADEATAGMSRSDRIAAKREERLMKILSTRDHRGPKKLGDIGFLTGKRLLLASIGVQIFYVAYDLATQITPFQKNLWDNVIWRGRTGPLMNARHAFRDVGEGWLAENLSRSRAWKGFKEKKQRTGGLFHKFIGRPVVWFETTIMRVPTREDYEAQGKKLKPIQRVLLGVACVTRGVAAGVVTYTAVHHLGVPFFHDISTHAASAAHTAVVNKESTLGGVANSHLRTVGSINPTLIGKANSVVGGELHTAVSNITTGIPNKIIGVVAGLAARKPNSLRADARRMRIASNIVDLKRTYHPWYGEPVKAAVREVARARVSAAREMAA